VRDAGPAPGAHIPCGRERVMDQPSGRPKEAWGSRLGIILAVMGSAVGLGNFLRFPGKAAQYEGGAFMIPYFVALLLLGIPIAWAEWSLGRYGGGKGHNSVPGILRAIWKHPAAPYVGALGMIIPVAIYMYYIYIEAWCLAYAVEFLLGTFQPEPGKAADVARYKEYFTLFAGLNEDGSAFTSFAGLSEDGAAFRLPRGVLHSALFYLVVCFVLNFVLIYRGLTKGIEWFCKWAMPALVVCALVVLVRVLTLGTPDPARPDLNVVNGLGFMWNPSTTSASFWESLGNSQMWLEAAGQIFFSLSVGFGIVMCYASYLKKDDDLALSSLTASAGNEFCEVALGGLITIPAAFVFLGAAGAMGAAKAGTFSLGFVTLPCVFAQMPFGQVVGFLFFFLLFLAAITSSLSMLQPAIALMEEGLGLGRRASVSLLGFVTAVGTGFVVWFSKDARALDTIDFWVGTFCIYVFAMVQVFLFGWVLGVEKGHEELSRGAEIRIPRWVMLVIKYVCPLYLLLVFGAWLCQNAGGYLKSMAHDPVAAMSFALILLVLVFFLLLIAQAVRRWQKDEQKGKEASP
jgi:SNF family Na+-dependent transporter